MQDNCERVKEMLSLYIDDMLCDDERKAIEKHLESCDSCKGEYEFLKSIAFVAKEMPALSVSGDLHAKIMQAATEQPARKPARHSLWRLASGFAAAAAVVAISVISFSNLPGHPDLTPVPATEINTPAPKVDTPDVIPEASAQDIAPSGKVAPAPVQAETPAPVVAAEEPVTPAAESVPITAQSEEAIDTVTVEPEDGATTWSRTIEPVACYYIGDASYEEAVLILDAYEFDGIAYVIPAEEKEAVYAKLQALPDYVRHVEESGNTETVRIALMCE